MTAREILRKWIDTETQFIDREYFRNWVIKYGDKIGTFLKAHFDRFKLFLEMELYNEDEKKETLKLITPYIK